MSAPEVLDLDTVVASPVVDEWRELAWSMPGTSFFQSPEWAEAWWDHLADRPPTRVALWRAADGRLEALAAMSSRSERLHRRVAVPISFWTNTGSGPGAADHTGALAAADRRAEVAAWMASLDGSLLLRNVAPGGVTPDGASILETSPCPRLAIPPDDEPIGRSSKFRKRLRRNSRILRENGIDFVAVAGPDITTEMLERLMDLHEARSDDQGWSTTFTPERVGFHRQLIETSEAGRGPGMMTAVKDGDIVGILYGFWWADSFSYFQTGWDPSWWELSLGTALVYEMILHARAEGAVIFDFLRGPEEYKYRFGAEDLVDETWLLPRGASGKALAAKARI
jgi:CelD/BcsL family acetyltransferase involved in cellulose biosynthesis